jgi:hypothetical protein
MAMAEHLFRHEPVFEIAAFRAPIFNPKDIGCVLNFRLSWFAGHKGVFAFHGNIQVGLSLRRDADLRSAAVAASCAFLAG